ncbi:MAG: sigma-70 family RNA polymerase sigma factor [Erysipelotrichaceae bacterium]
MMEIIDNEKAIIEIQNGNDELKEEFVKANTPLVYAIVKRFSHSRLGSDELFQIGCIGLMKAINKFDISYEVKFSTYAVPVIMGEIKRFFRDDGTMRISRSLKEGYLKMTKVKEQLTQVYNRDVTYQEIADYMVIDVSDVILAFEANQFIYSLDEPIYEKDGNEIHLSDKVANNSEEDIVLRLSLDKEISNLSQRERLILYYRYDLGMKQDEIALKLHISQVQVSRLEKKIIEKLREALMIC